MMTVEKRSGSIRLTGGDRGGAPELPHSVGHCLRSEVQYSHRIASYRIVSVTPPDPEDGGQMFGDSFALK